MDHEIQVGKIKQMLVTTEEWNEIPVLSPISCVNLGKLLKLLCVSVSTLLYYEDNGCLASLL